MKKILFVCTGNTCRSSMAQALFQSAVDSDSRLAGEYEAASAGIAAFDGDPASRCSIRVLRRDWNLDLSRHRARRVSREDVASAFLVLTMTASHRDHLKALFPEESHKIYTLREYAGSSSRDIADPFGGSEEVYGKCACEIKEAIDRVIIRLKA